jgi:hypothetical protein
MRRAVTAAAAVCLLSGPTVLAFFSGGYYAEPRVIAAIVAWILVLALALVGPAPVPRSRAGWAAVAGLGLLTAWTAISIGWAPLAGPAVEDAERLALYLGVLLAAIGTLRSPMARRALEPALAAGATVVLGYGLAGRLLPDLVVLAHSRSAGGRLEQPITYWNGEGALAAMGLVLCARMVGDRTRPAWMRALAAGATVPLGAGLYLSYSRGSIAAGVLGLACLVALVPTRAQLRAIALTIGATVAAALASAPFAGVASLEGAHRARDGAIVLALLVLLAAVAALLGRREARATADAPLPGAQRLPKLAAVTIALVTVALVLGGLRERPSRAELSAGAKATRLASVSSNRYEYWRVALGAFAAHPVEGLGAGGFRVRWLQERRITENVKDTHSLELEVAAELGLVGLLALALLAGGVIAAARRGLVLDRAAVVGPAVVLVVWAAHATIDWDWELPAVSGLSILAMAALLVSAER